MPRYDEFAIAMQGARLDLRPTSRISRVFLFFVCDAMAESSQMEPQDACVIGYSARKRVAIRHQRCQA
jgi:hypothetical protein